MDKWTIKTPSPICRLFFSIDLLNGLCGIVFNRFYWLENGETFTLFLTRFRIYKIASPPQTKITNKDYIKGLATTSCPCTITPHLCRQHWTHIRRTIHCWNKKLSTSSEGLKCLLFRRRPITMATRRYVPDQCVHEHLCLGFSIPRGNDVSHVSGLVRKSSSYSLPWLAGYPGNPSFCE